MDMIANEKRSYLRGDLSFKVRFRVVTSDEYETFKHTGDQFLSLDKASSIDIHSTDGGDTQISPNPYVLDLLLHSQEKLDQILGLLSNEQVDDGLREQGTGLNISGSGMNMIVDDPLEAGQILHTSFLLSRFPMVFIRVFGEVVRVKPFTEDSQTFYDLGLRFLYLNPDDREKIIACVFQSHRKALRNRKGKMNSRKES